MRRQPLPRAGQARRNETRLTAIEAERAHLPDEALPNDASLTQHVLDTINFGHDLLRSGCQHTREKGSQRRSPLTVDTAQRISKRRPDGRSTDEGWNEQQPS
jgi:hypothetical protein